MAFEKLECEGHCGACPCRESAWTLGACPCLAERRRGTLGHAHAAECKGLWAHAHAGRKAGGTLWACPCRPSVRDFGRMPMPAESARDARHAHAGRVPGTLGRMPMAAEREGRRHVASLSMLPVSLGHFSCTWHV
ncbi:hypothetical protein HAX54_013121 [Datura stramonium]|uniref:Uncharacterized protein n=1 Tax=Datura stramonium TaxID=4076 RepID=A0ABS8TNG7_DATST|nr:hypothetical protein [Datura stramonium]